MYFSGGGRRRRAAAAGRRGQDMVSTLRAAHCKVLYFVFHICIMYSMICFLAQGRIWSQHCALHTAHCKILNFVFYALYFVTYILYFVSYRGQDMVPT